MLRSTQEASPVLLELLFEFSFFDLTRGKHLKRIFLVNFESEREVARTKNLKHLEKKLIFLELVNEILLGRFWFFALIRGDLFDWVDQAVRVEVTHIKSFAALKKINCDHRWILRLCLDLAFVQEERDILGLLWRCIVRFLGSISDLSDSQSIVDRISNFFLQCLDIVGVEMLHFLSG